MSKWVRVSTARVREAGVAISSSDLGKHVDLMVLAYRKVGKNLGNFVGEIRLKAIQIMHLHASLSWQKWMQECADCHGC